MTTLTALSGPCQTERCEYAVGINPIVLCDKPLGAWEHASESTHDAQMSKQGHRFVEHTHTQECSARYWREVHGCEVLVTDVITCHTRGHRHRFNWLNNLILPDILGSPASDEARLAAFAILDDVPEWEPERQVAFIAYFIQTFDLHDQIRASVWDLPAVLLELLKHLTPAALAMADWAATEERS